MLRREAIIVRGVVQGVGFRPFVYRLATEEGLAGFIGNDTGGVTIEIEGPAENSGSISAPPRSRGSAALAHRLGTLREAFLRNKKQAFASS